MARESHDVKLTRIEVQMKEGFSRLDMMMNRVESSVIPLAAQVQSHTTEIAILKNDKKWNAKIWSGVSGMLGAAIVYAAEFFRK